MTHRESRFQAGALLAQKNRVATVADFTVLPASFLGKDGAKHAASTMQVSSGSGPSSFRCSKPSMHPSLHLSESLRDVTYLYNINSIDYP